MNKVTLHDYLIDGNPDNMPVVVVSLIEDSDIIPVRAASPDHLIVGWQDGVDVFITDSNSVAILSNVTADYFMINTPPTTAEIKVCNTTGCEIIEIPYGDFEDDDSPDVLDFDE
jgi:hypothetical protein